MLNAHPHPWVRFGATSLDFALVNLILTALEAAWGAPLVPRLSRLFPDLGPGLVQAAVSSSDSISPILLTSLLEALLLCTLGTTPGKTLMGLTLRRADGGRLTPAQAFGRAGLKFVWGWGLGIALLDAIAQVRSYVRSNNGRSLPWERDFSYTMSPRSTGSRLAAYFIPAAVLLLLIYALGGWPGGGA